MNEATQPGMRRATAIVVLAVSALALAVLLALGTWQVQRLHWKEGLLATIQERTTSQPHSLQDVETRLTTTGDVDYWPVRVGGVFHHEGERHFFATWKGASGYFVHTPLELDDGRLIFVNRGFVPFDRKDPATRPEGQVQGRVEILGLARAAITEKPSFIVPDNDPAKNIFYWKDSRAMAATSGVGAPDDYVGFFIDADDAPNPGGLPVGGVTMIDLPNNHLQYVVTWYGLAAALCGVVGVWLWRMRKVT
ncbi:SURF1 family protein [Aquamicrobium sp. LC103]|uniref:SURF1 family protein n=1 Tax=Aquamicrobium sp. LC103 TaxID=1120658 RepID=UPI00063EBEF4|nr:SURF1 family protein [Aquamicrobium sp. LC103]TKT81148.1 SURF1 family protein [Aquamicrobium sp. LC103]